ncbi:MAG: GFA family protein [Gammaproteobacteria bacterium]
MTIRHAGCSCGQLKLTARVDPLRVSICHCLACQRRSGSTYGAQARFPADQVEIEGPSTIYTRIGDEGNRITFHFCPVCGSTVYYQIEDMAEFVAVPVGAFADPDFPPPGVSVYEARRHDWVRVPEGVEHFD